jgi:U6 snRNA-associated Sm-like protein LSm4
LIYAPDHTTPQLVELKNGETFNGHLVNCDNFMNITLREVYQTNTDGDKFWKLKECYIRGSTVRMCCRPSVLRGVDLIWLDKVPPDT